MKWKQVGLILTGVGVGLAVVGAGTVGWAVATFEAGLAFPDTKYPDLQAATEPGAVERGRYLVYGPAHCAQCHSATDRAHPEQVNTEPVHGGLAFELGPLGTLYARNLTSDAKTGIGRRSDAELARAIRTGVLPEGQLSVFMRYSAATLSDDDIRDVMAYLRSTEPVVNDVPPATFTVLGKVVVKLLFPTMTPRPLEGPVGVASGVEPTVERGRYLAEDVMLCAVCHTAMDPATFEFVGPKAGGSLPDPSHGADSDMEFCAPNLTLHPTGMTGKLDEDAFVARFRKGRQFASSIMPWENFGATTDVDLRSVYRYLRTLPPVDRDVGPTYRKAGWTP